MNSVTPFALLYTYTFTANMEAARSSETVLSYRITTRRHNPKHS